MIEDHDDLPGLTPEEEIAGLGNVKDSVGQHFLDKDETVQKHFRMVWNWWRYERETQADNRIERMLAEDMYDGDQWEEEDVVELEKRGQHPSVFNRIKPTLDWVIGTERKTRVDYNILPRGAEDSDAADAKTELMKYIMDINLLPFHISRAFNDSSKSGIGWIDTGVRSDPSEIPIFGRYEDWRNVWPDSRAKSIDYSDGRFMFYSKVVDLDVGVAMFPDRADAIRIAMNSEDIDELVIGTLEEDISDSAMSVTADANRNRVRLILCEYRVPVKAKMLRGKSLGSLNGAVYREENAGMKLLVDGGHASLYDGIRMRMHRMIFAGNSVLAWGERKYNHDEFSLVGFVAYRKKRNNSPYGVIKQLIDPQRDLNKRRSKALWLLSTKQKVVEESAVEDLDQFIEEADRPDGCMVVRDGVLTANRIKFIDDRSLAREHVMLMEQDAQFIESIGGVTDENRGIQTNATSGQAIRARQDQGFVNTAELFDNYRLGFTRLGQILQSLIEQYIVDEMVVRITDDPKSIDFLTVNRELPDGGIENDITASQADFVVDAQSFSASIRQALFIQLGELIAKLPPEISMHLIDLWLEMSDVPGKEVMVERVRKLVGIEEPGQEGQEKPPDPGAELEMEERKAKLEKIMADVEKIKAGIETEKEKVKIQKASALHQIEKDERMENA